MCSNCRENHKKQKFSADSKPELEGCQGISQILPLFEQYDSESSVTNET